MQQTIFRFDTYQDPQIESICPRNDVTSESRSLERSFPQPRFFELSIQLCQ